MERQYRRLLDKVEVGNKCVILTILDKNNGTIVKKTLFSYEDINNSNNSQELSNDVAEKIFEAIDTGNLISYEIEDNKVIIIEPFIPKPRLFVFGGGHVSKPIVELALKKWFFSNNN